MAGRINTRVGMLQTQSIPEALPVNAYSDVLPTHFSFSFVYSKIKQWLKRFHFHEENALLNELMLFYFLAPKKHLDHRTNLHCFRSVLTLYLLQKQLLHSLAFSQVHRHIKMRWIPAKLFFPFSSKPVLGCFVGFNTIDRYELFDEENVTLALEKHFLDFKIVKESFYAHASQHKDLKIFYFEIEKKDGTAFSLVERKALKASLEEKIKNSIQILSPVIFTNANEEEIYKQILVLSREIESAEDLPHAYISLDQHSGKEIAFRVILVYFAPHYQISLKNCFLDCTFVSERVFPVRQVDNRPIEAQIFRLLFPRDPSYLRSDGSLDFYSAREKAVASIQSAIGEFRDYNGGILLKQQELFREFKNKFPEVDSELLNEFFYTLAPLEKKVILRSSVLCTLFANFLENRKTQLNNSPYSFVAHYHKPDFLFSIQVNHSSYAETISSVLQKEMQSGQQMVCNFIETTHEIFFNCVLFQTDAKKAAPFLQVLREELHRSQQKKSNLQILRIGAEYLPYSLDPRIGGDLVSGNILRLLFEGLTRFDQHGNLENALAQSIDITSDGKLYHFKLRSSFWNDGSPVTAYDFEYAWKKILSPHFETTFASPFFPIKHAKEAKEGRSPLDEVGIKAIDDRTLRVELAHPVPYFLQLTTLPLFSPVHQKMDHQCPQWPYQSDTHYPCNGPFQLKINKPAQSYQLVKNPFYWSAKQVVLDEVIIKQMNSHQLYQEFRRNEVDWIGNPLGGWNSSYVAAEGDRLLSLDHWTCWQVFNTESSLLNLRKLREAIVYSIDRTEMTSSTSLALFPAHTILSPSATQPHSLFPERNIEKAQFLFKEALEELQLSHEEFPRLTLLFNQQGVREHAARLLQRQLWEAIGVRCELLPLPWNQFYERLVIGDFHIALIHWISPVDDPMYTLNSFRFAKDAGNFSNWENLEFQQLLSQSEKELNPFQRSIFLLKAEKILAQEVPLVPLFFQASQALVKQEWQVPYKDSPGIFNFSRILKHKV